MTTDTQLVSKKETAEILEAACSALDYSLDHAKVLRRNAPDAEAVPDLLIQGLKATMAAQSTSATAGAIRGHVANALGHLRTSLQAMQEVEDAAEEAVELATKATARSIALLYPLTQTEGPLLLVPRKHPGRSRRKPAVNAGRGGVRPKFDVALGVETETNFFAGFEGNIASGGLFIATYDIHPIGAPLSVKARLPGGRVVAEGAVVSWIREYNEASPDISPGMGVVFEDLGGEDARSITRFMSSREAIFYEAV